MKKTALLVFFFLPPLTLADAPIVAQSSQIGAARATDEGSPPITDEERKLIRQLTPVVAPVLKVDGGVDSISYDTPSCRAFLRSLADGKLEYLQPSVVAVKKEDEALRKKLEPCSISQLEYPYSFRPGEPIRYTVYEPRPDDVVEGVNSPLFVKAEGYLYIVSPEQFHQDPEVVGTVWYYLFDRNSRHQSQTEIHGGWEYPPESSERRKQSVSHPHGLVRYDGKIMVFDLSPEWLGSGGGGPWALTVYRPDKGPLAHDGWAVDCAYHQVRKPRTIEKQVEEKSLNKPLELTR